MSFFDRLFGRNKDKRPAAPKLESKQQTNNLQKQIQQIETNISAFFPRYFKQFLVHHPEKEIILDLMDDRYRILHSLRQGMAYQDDDDVVTKSIDLSSRDYYPEDPNFIKIPFARSLTGDGYKYLYFLAQKGEPASEHIYIRDMDAPNTSRIKIAEKLDFILGEETETATQIIASNKQLKFSDFEAWITLPDKINRGKVEGMTRPNQKERATVLNIDLHAKICEFADPAENFANFYVDMTLVTSSTISFYNIPYEVDIPGLRYNVENNVNYRIFYHKFIAIVDALRVLMAEEGIDKVAILDLINDLDWSAVTKKGFVQIDYYQE